MGFVCVGVAKIQFYHHVCEAFGQIWTIFVYILWLTLVFGQL